MQSFLQPVRYQWSIDWNYSVEMRGTEGQWSICYGSYVMNTDGILEYEPSPSLRNEEFKRRTRFDTIADCETLLIAYYKNKYPGRYEEEERIQQMTKGIGFAGGDKFQEEKGIPSFDELMDSFDIATPTELILKTALKEMHQSYKVDMANRSAEEAFVDAMSPSQWTKYCALTSFIGPQINFPWVR